MPIRWVQKLYDSIKNIKTPPWLVDILEKLQAIIKSIALQIGKDAIDKLRDKIIEVSEEDIPSWPDKFKKVRDWAGEELKLSYFGKTFVDTLIQSLVAELKKEEKIS